MDEQIISSQFSSPIFLDLAIEEREFLIELSTLFDNNDDHSDRIQCTNDLLHISKILLSSNELSGYIPFSVGNLQYLTHLDLSLNGIEGQIPSSIGELTSLEILYLNDNFLCDMIPDSLGNLTNLYELNLSMNELKGNIPSSIGNLSKLRKLSLNNNHIEGEIPSSIGNLVSLDELYLHCNDINGIIPSSIGNLSNLTSLHLDRNKLKGCVPSSIGNLTKLTNLFIGNNDLPSTIGNLLNLKELMIDIESLYCLPLHILSLHNLEKLYIGPFNREDKIIPTYENDDIYKYFNELIETHLSFEQLEIKDSFNDDDDNNNNKNYNNIKDKEIEINNNNIINISDNNIYSFYLSLIEDQLSSEEGIKPYIYDFEIEISKKKWYFHKFIIASRCPALLNIESNHNDIINSFSIETSNQFARWIYSGEFLFYLIDNIDIYIKVLHELIILFKDILDIKYTINHLLQEFDSILRLYNHDEEIYLKCLKISSKYNIKECYEVLFYRKLPNQRISIAIDIRDIFMDNELLKSVFDCNINDLDIIKNGVLDKNIDLIKYFKENIKEMQENISHADLIFSFNDEKIINMNKAIVWHHCPFLHEKIMDNNVIKMNISDYNLYKFIFKYIYILESEFNLDNIDDCNIIIDIYLFGCEYNDENHLGKAIYDLYLKCKSFIEDNIPSKILMIQLFNRLTSKDMKKNETMLEYVYNKLKYYDDLEDKDFTDDAIEILHLLGWNI